MKNRAGVIILFILSIIFTGCTAGAAEPTQVITPSLLPPTVTVEPTNIPTPSVSETALPSPTVIVPTATLTSTTKPTSAPRPTPDWTEFREIGGGMIAFVSDRDGDYEIYLMEFPSAEEAQPVEYQLTYNDAKDSVPEWSPDGKKIAYASTRDGNWEIYILDVEQALHAPNGIVLQRLTNHESDDLSPVWSPDGTQIAFASKRDGDWDIYVMGADGTHIRPLTDSPGIETKPSWSPDGSKIAFDSGASYNRDIFIMDADGSNPELVARADGGWPAWSPDGTRIAFFGRLAGNPDIYVMNVDGTNMTRLTENNVEDWEPSWSTDGEWLLYVSGAVPDIYVMRADGSETYRLTQDQFEDWTPAWRP